MVAFLATLVAGLGVAPLAAEAGAQEIAGWLCAWSARACASLLIHRLRTL